MLKRFCLLAVGTLLTACVSNPIPDDYRGPVSTITDSALSQGMVRVNLFYLSKVNGKAVNETERATTDASRGGPLNARVVSRSVPAASSTFTIVGHTHFLAPVFQIFGKTYEVSGDVTFTPLPDRTYVVVGVLSDTYSAVWIQDSQSGDLMGQRIEMRPQTPASPP